MKNENYLLFMKNKNYLLFKNVFALKLFLCFFF